MKRLLHTIMLLLIAVAVSAQGIDPILTQLMQDNAKTVAQSKAKGIKTGTQQQINAEDTLSIQRRVNVNFNNDGTIRQLCIIGTLNDGQQCPNAELQQLGIKVTCVVGQLVIMDVPVESYNALTKMKQWKWLAADKVHHLDNKQARETNTVSYVTGEKTFSALQGSKYDGTGVVVGVIDIGIDFNHIAFKDADGNTRVKEAITFNSESDTPIITTGDAIANLTTGNIDNSHGTHTSAIAAGSYIGSIGKQGMAPGADLVLCDCSTGLSDSHIIASAKEIFRYADSEGKPAVINLSIGANVGFHDGSDTQATAFNTLTSAKPGRIICVSSSNCGDQKMSVRKTLNKGETLKTVLKSYYKETNTQGAYYVKSLCGFMYANDGNPFTVEYKAVDITTGQEYPISEKPLYTSTEVSLGTTPTKYSNNKYGLWLDNSSCFFKEANLHLAICITAGEDNQEIVYTDNIAAKGYINLVGEKYNSKLSGYTDGNADVSINTIACTPGVISVGAYQDRSKWHSIDGVDHWVDSFNKYSVGSISMYSSYGIDDNGKHHPDVIATGTYINSAYNSYDTSYFYGSGTGISPKTESKYYITDQISGTSRPYFYGEMSGTSMSCPMVTGIVALWLQKDPTLTTEKVRELIQKSSIQDKYTTIAENTPSGNIIQAGNGKIDALRGIEMLSNITADETLTMARNITTFSSSNMLDFRNPNGPKAYVASAFDNGTLTFTRVLDRVPANTGLLITAAPDTYNIPISPASTTLSTNYLYGTADAAKTLVEEGAYYVLANSNGKVGFYQNAANLTVPQYKAYLQLPNNQGQEAKSIGYMLNENTDTPEERLEGTAVPRNPEFNLNVNNDNATGIKEVNTCTERPLEIYNLNGCKVQAPTRGLYIINGKKVIFK